MSITNLTKQIRDYKDDLKIIHQIGCKISLTVGQIVYLDVDGLYKPAIATSEKESDIKGIVWGFNGNDIFYLKETSFHATYRYPLTKDFFLTSGGKINPNNPDPSKIPGVLGSPLYLSETIAGGMQNNAPDCNYKVFIGYKTAIGFNFIRNIGEIEDDPYLNAEVNPSSSSSSSSSSHILIDCEEFDNPENPPCLFITNLQLYVFNDPSNLNISINDINIPYTMVDPISAGAPYTIEITSMPDNSRIKLNDKLNLNGSGIICCVIHGNLNCNKTLLYGFNTTVERNEFNITYILESNLNLDSIKPCTTCGMPPPDECINCHSTSSTSSEIPLPSSSQSSSSPSSSQSSSSPSSSQSSSSPSSSPSSSQSSSPSSSGSSGSSGSSCELYWADIYNCSYACTSPEGWGPYSSPTVVSNAIQYMETEWTVTGDPCVYTKTVPIGGPTCVAPPDVDPFPPNPGIVPPGCCPSSSSSSQSLTSEYKIQAYYDETIGGHWCDSAIFLIKVYVNGDLSITFTANLNNGSDGGNRYSGFYTFNANVSDTVTVTQECTIGSCHDGITGIEYGCNNGGPTFHDRLPTSGVSITLTLPNC